VLRAALFLFASLIGPAATAAADSIKPLRHGQLPREELSRPFHDRVITGERPARAAQALRGVRADYTTADGYQVELETSPSYGDTTPTQAQATVNFVASRAHGTELGELKIYLGKPNEIKAECGSSQAVACYYTRENKMFVPGEQDPSGIPAEYAITHEYGHHIASFRKNSLGQAFILGPQYWATHERICAGVRNGEFKPGDQEDGYLDNPGEGFADAFAHLPEHYPTFPFQFNQKFVPDQAAIDQLRRDIVTPWTAPRIDRNAGALSRAVREQTITVPVTQDGRVAATLRAPRRARFDLQVVADGRVVDQARRRRNSSRRKVAGTFCAPEDGPHGTLSFRVLRRSGSGSFSLTSSVAG
jgi:hypothetical protein